MVAPVPAKPALASATLAELARVISAAGQSPYRAKQVFAWVQRRNVLDPRLMSDLPAAFREQLLAACETAELKLASQAKSSDGSLKYCWLTVAGDPIEAVLMPGFDYGTAVCLSSHSGCPLSCKFCATGRMGLRAKLSAAEIMQQLSLAQRLSGCEPDRAVFMGMGEPLLNLPAVVRCVELLCDEAGRGWSPRRITLSTVGLLKPLVEAARSLPRVNLALSLHFTTAEKRAAHMPKAEQRIERLTAALLLWHRLNGGKITLEYCLMEGLNDSERDAKRLVRCALLQGIEKTDELALEALELPLPSRAQPLPLHVNLIAYNPVGVKEYQPVDEAKLNAFARQLADADVPVSVRRSRAPDIAAACGMLGAAHARKT